ncbi:MAG TPA: GntG family PLP-dependent aldolase [Mycobacteriales bacterium]|nr:GntG family PLP-dependent aldolase [Mycobacteriales bacterium]
MTREPVVDLRSDTVTAPTAGMRAAMAAAPVGDDVYGEDPTVQALEARVAALLGHEAGLFVVSGSLGNQLGLRLACPPGGELLCDEGAHVVTYELGAAAALAGITTRTFGSRSGVPDPAAIAAMIRPEGYGTVPTCAIALEQTHNRAGGTVLPVHILQSIRTEAQANGVQLHVDGARLWNACVATGLDPAAYGRLADTVSVCLSKGLGAPVGSVLVGTASAIAQARVWRKRLGGGWRQAGILAAAGLFALEHHLPRLSEDHTRARRLAAALGLAGPETNIVPVPVTDSDAAVARCAAAGIRIGAVAPGILRAVTHLDIDDAGLERAIGVLGPLLRRP